ncbi:MAG: hypothetical protein JWR19_1231 [Pedosphaera sp.]|nr:hypothetical protein [Pedosphaera sp.]
MARLQSEQESTPLNMKRSLAFVLVLSVAAGNLFGQAELVKERAKRQRDINNEQQGIAPPPPSAPAPQPGTPPPAPAVGPRTINPAQQLNIDKLQTDLVAIPAGSPVTPEQKQRLQADFLLLAKGATKPSKESLTRLTDDLSSALADKNVSVKDHAQLAKNLNIILNNGGLSAPQATTFVTATQGILKAAGVADADLQTIGKDLKAIVTEIQNGKPRLFQ